MATVNNTNRKFLDANRTASRPAIRLTGSAERDGVRIIATVFGFGKFLDFDAQPKDGDRAGFQKGGNALFRAITPMTNRLPARSRMRLCQRMALGALRGRDGGSGVATARRAPRA